MAEDDNVVNPGQSKDFVYVGELIPNDVNIQNLSEANTAIFTLKSGTEGWKLWWAVLANQTTTLTVEWFNGVATFSNISEEDASIRVFGEDIRPYYGDESTTAGE